ncbi:hypothetical protein ACIBSW_01740 [Actinoplanes sp. NPDC049668]|uniref:hypothetical protein n=1 Tax=unclassified Actinoplanes TaxID=2626549 RepID=UPI0033A2E9AC
MTALARRRTRRAPSLTATLLLRCALYLGPLSVAIAAFRPLAGAAWQVPTGTLLLGWGVAQALAGAGAAVTRRRGPGAAARLVGCGNACAAAAWCAFVLLAPAAVGGGSPAGALAIGVCGLATLATVTAALVTHAELAVIRWSLPCWLLAAVSVAGAIGDTLAARVPVTLLLPVAIALAALKAFRPAFGPAASFRLRAADLHGAAGRLVLGVGQAGCAVLLWRAGPPAATSPAVLPLLAAVPVLEALIGWHRRQVEAGLDVADSDEDYREHVGGVNLVTIAALLPPLAAGLALALGAYRLPVGLEGARAGVLAFAGGILLSGLLAVTLLLAARDATVVAAALAVAPPLAAVATPLVPALPPDPLPTVVAILAATHLVGLLTVARTDADPRRM